MTTEATNAPPLTEHRVREIVAEMSTWLNTTLAPNVGHSFTMAYESTSGTPTSRPTI
jgi:hypothetical protein